MHTHQCVSQVYEQSRLDVLQDQFEFLFPTLSAANYPSCLRLCDSHYQSRWLGA
jgi:hypothetical protein